MKVAIIGAGRLGTSLHHMLHIPSILVERKDPIPQADVYWLTVRDAQISSVSSQLPKGALVIHSSGVLGLEPIVHHAKRAVLHPMMTFSGPEHIPTRPIPATYECPKEIEATVLWLANQVGFEPHPISGDRALYHAASVFAGNYASLLLEIGGDLLEQYNIPPEVGKKMLLPLALKSMENASNGPLKEILTGPIARGDQSTINNHKMALALYDEEIAKVYDLMCSNIQRCLSKTDPND